jgi:hypothetical protein
VTIADVLVEARAVTAGSSNPLYEMDHDGRITRADVAIVARQLGRRCSR